MTLNRDSEELAELVEELKAYRIGEWNVRLGREQDWRCMYCGKDLLGTFDTYNSWHGTMSFLSRRVVSTTSTILLFVASRVTG
jgi:hypothetical protein